MSIFMQPDFVQLTTFCNFSRRMFPPSTACGNLLRSKGKDARCNRAPSPTNLPETVFDSICGERMKKERMKS